MEHKDKVACEACLQLDNKIADSTPALLAEQDVVAIVSGHRVYDYDWIVQHASLVVDTVNATRGVVQGRFKIVRIGEPFRLISRTRQGDVTTTASDSA